MLSRAKSGLGKRTAPMPLACKTYVTTAFGILVMGYSESNINHEGIKIMKRLLIITLLALTVFSFTMGTGLDITLGADFTGQALGTDIRAYVNGQMLSCLIINGRTAIVAEDLRGCGFDVVWQPVERKLEITENASLPIDKQSVASAVRPEIPAGAAQVVLETDIKTFLDQQEINSFNIGGYTAIYLNELSPYGELNWDPVQREARFVSSRLSGPLTGKETVDDANLIAEQIDRREATVEFRGEKAFCQEQQVGYIRNGKAMISLDWMAKWLGYQVEFSQDGYLVKRGCHYFRIKAADRQAEVFYEGSPARSVELYELPILSSSRLYLYTLDMESMFGLDSHWNETTRQWQISYTDYRIKERGNYQAGSSLAVKVRYITFPAEYNPPELSVENITLASGGLSGDYRAYGSGDGQQYNAIATLAVLRDNEMQMWLGKKNRALFYQRMIVRGTPENHQLEKQNNIGPFTQYNLVKPEQGFTSIGNNSFQVEGQITGVNEPIVHILVAKIDKFSGAVTELPEQTLLLQEHKFSGPVALNAGPGLYRVRFQVKTTGLHGIVALTQFGEFYLDYCDEE